MEHECDKTVGFLGCGNMGEAIMAGMLRAHVISAERVIVCARTDSTVKRLRETYGVRSATAEELVQCSDIIMLGVKLYTVKDILCRVARELSKDKLIVSMAAGVTLDMLERCLPLGRKVIRVMPNTAVSVGCGITALTANAAVSVEEKAHVMHLFAAVGKAFEVEESAMHAVIAMCASSPAYVFTFVDALCDGGVYCGLPRQQTCEMAAQLLRGAAEMLEMGTKTPGQLRDMVCSPGGTTIEAVRFLEKGGLRSTVIEAMIQCMQKSKQMESQPKS